MKKLLIVALALFALQVTAQDKKEMRQEKMEHLKDMDPVEMAKLQTKKMTLALDLNQDQQSKVLQLNTKNAKLRKAAMEKRMALKDADKKPSKEEKLKMVNEKLDHQIATKREMKTILTKEQYEKFNKMAEKKMRRGNQSKAKQKRGRQGDSKRRDN